MDHGEKDHERPDLVLEKLQRVKEKWNKDRIKHFHFINKRLQEINETKAYINNALVIWSICKTIETLTTWALVIRFLPSINRPGKWWTIICYSGHRPSDIALYKYLK